MNRHILILNTMILLLVSTAVLSCSKAANDIEDIQCSTRPGEPYSLVISGSASDKDSSLPLEEIKITLTAVEKPAKGRETSLEKTSYTGSNGLFTLKADGFRNPVSIVLTAEDPNGRYKTATHEIPLITWDSSYNMDGNSFFINECNFYLEKNE